MISLLAEKPAFIVVDKPPGLAMHNDAGPEKTPEAKHGVISLIRRQLDDPALYPVHRLDRGTSGLLLIAKGKQATAELSQIFARRQVQKFYWALSERKARKKQGLVRGDMEKSRRGSWKLTRGLKAPATTYFFSCALSGGRRAYLLKPVTGKTHQLRVALKSLAAPILGDTRYGGAASDRLYLHASHLGFTLGAEDFQFALKPANGRYFLTEEFSRVFDQHARPEQLPWPNAHSNATAQTSPGTA